MKTTILYILAIIILLAIFGVIGIFTWTYAINSWLLFLGKPAVFPMWGGFLLGLLPLFGQASIPVAIITWILMMFLA